MYDRCSGQYEFRDQISFIIAEDIQEILEQLTTNILQSTSLTGVLQYCFRDMSDTT